MVSPLISLYFPHCLHFLPLFFASSRKLYLSLRPETRRFTTMDVKKVTYEEALARFRHSLEVKRAAEKRIAEEWARRGLTGTIVAL